MPWCVCTKVCLCQGVFVPWCVCARVCLCQGLFVPGCVCARGCQSLFVTECVFARVCVSQGVLVPGCVSLCNGVLRQVCLCQMCFWIVYFYGVWYVQYCICVDC